MLDLPSGKINRAAGMTSPMIAENEGDFIVAAFPNKRRANKLGMRFLPKTSD
jgi:hypothetical protein